MARFTSKANGNWSSSGQTTWNEVGVPAAGDVASITHSVTVDTATTIGNNSLPMDAVGPTLGKTTGGSLAVDTYAVRYSIVDTNGVENGAGVPKTIASDATNNRIQITLPALPTGGASYTIYVAKSGITSSWFRQATAVAAGVFNFDTYSTATAMVNQAEVLVSGNGRLIINANLTVHGGSVQLEGTATSTDTIVTQAAGTTFEISTAATLDATSLPIIWWGLTGSRTSIYWQTNGTSGSRCNFQANASGGNGRILCTGTATGDHSFAYTTFTRIGTSSVDFIAMQSGGTTPRSTIDHCIFNTCGRFNVANSLNTGGVFNWTYNTFKYSLATRNLLMSGASASPTGARVIKGCVFDGDTTISVNGMTIGGTAAADANIFMKFPVASGAQRTSVALTNCFFRTLSVTSLYRMGDWSECVVVCDGNTYDGNGRYSAKADLTNVHWINPQGGPSGRYAVDHCICESFGCDDQGDWDYGPNGSGFDSDISYCIGVPYKKDGHAAYMVGTLSTMNGWAGASSTYNHNTWYCGGQGVMAISEGGTGAAGMIDSLRSNICWNQSRSDTSTTFNRITYYPTHINNFTGLPSAPVVTARCGYNCRFNLYTGTGTETLTGAYTDGGALTHSYHHYDTSGLFDTTHDVTGDPGFVDADASFWKWVQSIVGATIPAPASGGSPISVDVTTESGRKDLFAWGLYQLGLKNEPTHADYNASFTVNAYKTYVRAGFAPTNSALKNAGHDGVTIGAVEGVFSGGVTDVTLQKITRGLNRGICRGVA